MVQAWDEELTGPRVPGYPAATARAGSGDEAGARHSRGDLRGRPADRQGANISTIYRTLELLEQLGLVTHTHLGHGAPRYHLAAEAEHVHLVCSQCGRVTQVGPEAVNALVAALNDTQGFETDVGHLTVFGTCAECRAAGPEAATPIT